jgi:adenylosuccinate synthase
MSKDIAVVLGAQWGDEGKGKLVDILSDTYSVIVRSGGGANAGHTIVRDGKKYVFHLLPSGMINENNIGVIGNGCVVNLLSLSEEIKNLEEKGISLKNRVFISEEAHLLFDFHSQIDALQESQKGDSLIGTTKRGIGPCYTDKIARIGIRACDFKAGLDVFFEKFEKAIDRVESLHNLTINREEEKEKYKKLFDTIAPLIVNTTLLLDKYQKENKKILIEGAQAFMLDIDHGTYPFVTSSSINTGGLGAGCGISPRKFSEIIGVTKAYCTRVGSGPFPSELLGEEGENLRKMGHEFGATTGRPRRCGWIDIVALKKFALVNAPDNWNITKLDVLSELKEVKAVVGYALNGKTINFVPSRKEDLEKVTPLMKTFPGWQVNISGIRKYDDLPENARKFLDFIEQETSVPVKYIGVGAGNDAIIVK